MVLMGVLSGNIIVMRIPITLTGYQAIIFRLRNPLIMKQPSKWHIKPVKVTAHSNNRNSESSREVILGSVPL